MPLYNHSKTVHNKCLQALGIQGCNLYVVTCNNWICAFMHMTNYHACFKGGAFETSPSKYKLKLKRVVPFMNERKFS